MWQYQCWHWFASVDIETPSRWRSERCSHTWIHCARFEISCSVLLRCGFAYLATSRWIHWSSKTQSFTRQVNRINKRLLKGLGTSLPGKPLKNIMLHLTMATGFGCGLVLVLPVIRSGKFTSQLPFSMGCFCLSLCRSQAETRVAPTTTHTLFPFRLSNYLHPTPTPTLPHWDNVQCWRLTQQLAVNSREGRESIMPIRRSVSSCKVTVETIAVLSGAKGFPAWK